MTLKINLKNLMSAVILLLITMTPLFSIMESLALIFGGLINNSTSLTPSYIKALKDVGFLILIVLSFIATMVNMKLNLTSLCALFLIFLTILLPAVLLMENGLVFATGVRWLMPIILLFFLVGKIDSDLMHKIGFTLFYLSLFHFAFQIFQLFFAAPWFGKNVFGLSRRNPGIFFIPNTSAFFSILVYFFSLFYMKSSFKKISHVLTPISILLTASGTGVVAFIVVFVIHNIPKKMLILLPLTLPILAILLFSSLGILTGRDHIVEQSFGPRVAIFMNLFQKASLLPSQFGFGTSTGYLIANALHIQFDAVPTESQLAGVIVNLGLLNALVIFLALPFIFCYLFIRKSHEKIIFVLIFIMFSLTTSFTESFPANLLFAVVVSYFLNKEKPNGEYNVHSIQ